MLSSASISAHKKVHCQDSHHVCEVCNHGTGESGGAKEGALGPEAGQDTEL
uniref:Uncharacterized protein n=1 Tax=Panthera leo TaxID=9689 RepID=A0A8C8WM69_PANLE